MPAPFKAHLAAGVPLPKALLSSAHTPGTLRRGPFQSFSTKIFPDYSRLAFLGKSRIATQLRGVCSSWTAACGNGQDVFSTAHNRDR
jgi:hypothetical protein